MRLRLGNSHFTLRDATTGQLDVAAYDRALIAQRLSGGGETQHPRLGDGISRQWLARGVDRCHRRRKFDGSLRRGRRDRLRLRERLRGESGCLECRLLRTLRALRWRRTALLLAGDRL